MNARQLTNLFKKILFLLYARRPVIMLSEYETPVTDFLCSAKVTQALGGRKFEYTL